MKPREITPRAARIIGAGLTINDDLEQGIAPVGFMARAMIQATLPHRKVPGNEFERRNGHYTLTIMAPSRIGLPYGSVPRILLAWLTTEAARTKSRELELGDSMSGFMRAIGMRPTGGPRGDITRLKDQATRLFASTITAIYHDREKTALMPRPVAEEALLWWHARDPGQASLWRSTVTLSEPFFREIVERPVPVSMDAIAALKRSPMALDIYTWLTYRASYARKPSLIPWQALALQFGSEYGRLRAFREAFLAELGHVLAVYPGARAEMQPEGVLFKPSKPHVPPSRLKAPATDSA